MKLKRSTVVFLALFLVFSVAVTWMVFATLQRNVAGPTSNYSAIFSDVSGLAEGDDVRVAGVRVGRVNGIELTPDNQAKVSFEVRSNQTLYTNTLASVTYQNIIGQRYLGLSQGEGEREKLAPGAEIPESHTNPSFDISYMLNGFEPLFSELDPQQVDNLTNAIIAAFQGDQGSVLTLTTQAAELSRTLAGPDEVLGQMIGDLDTLMVSLAEQSADAIRKTGTLSHILTFFEWEYGVLPYSKALAALLPTALLTDQRTAVLRIESPQHYTSALAELRFPTGNRGGWVQGLEDFFHQHLVPGALITLSRTAEPHIFTLTYEEQPEQQDRLLVLDEKKNKLAFANVSYY